MRNEPACWTINHNGNSLLVNPEDDLCNRSFFFLVLFSANRILWVKCLNAAHAVKADLKNMRGTL
jgi:hypothetical protein